MKSLVTSSDPGMKVPVPLRFLWLFSGVILLALANANLAYLMAVPTVAPVVENFTSHEAVSESDDGLANICTLTDVVCDGEFLGEMPVAVNPQRGKVLLDSPRPVSTVIKKNASKKMQERIDYAWEISKNVDFILTVEKESDGTWDEKLRSYKIGANKKWDWGACQVNEGYHRKIVHDDRFFTDWKWQMDTCWNLYKSGTRFYGYDRRHEVRNRFVMK